jgi:hypothetical protein
VRRLPLPLLLGVLVALAATAHAERVSDVRQTRHNLSGTGPGATRATTETQVCVFCHTPHGATTTDQGGVAVNAPLWNRAIPPGSTYTPYTSASLDANVIQGQLDQPGGSSKLCLSCHDGTLALGNVNVLNGQTGQTIAMSNTGPGGTMPPGAGATSGFTRVLGVDLRNDHPISVTYTAQLVDRDGELRTLDANQRWPGPVRQLPRPASLRDRPGEGRPEVPAWTALPGSGAEHGRLQRRYRHHLRVVPRQEPDVGHLGELGARQSRRRQ